MPVRLSPGLSKGVASPRQVQQTGVSPTPPLLPPPPSAEPAGGGLSAGDATAEVAPGAEVAAEAAAGAGATARPGGLYLRAAQASRRPTRAPYGRLPQWSRRVSNVQCPVFS